MTAGGPREIHLRDWPFGAVGRRLLLEALLVDPQPKEGWTKTALERRAAVSVGGIDEVLAGALQLRLVERRDGRWFRRKKLPPIAKPLAALVAETNKLPNAPLAPLPRRPYQRRM